MVIIRERLRLVLFLAVFVAFNLALIPLISLYGLRVCPILNVPGFGFGCIYSSFYVFCVNVINIILLFHFRESSGWRNTRLLIFGLSYFAAGLLAIILLMILLNRMGLPIGARGPEILLLASLLIGILQAYGINWVQNRKYTGPGLAGTVGNEHRPLDSHETFKKLWLAQVTRTMFPLLVTVLVIAHFKFRQSASLNNGHIAPLVPHDDLINQSIYLIAFLTLWMLLVFLFHFLSERDYVENIQDHLNAVEKLNTQYQSATGEAWGLWKAIFQQLNSFSRVLGERTRLLRSFSRFVSTQVAEQALKKEIKEVDGLQMDLTVLMSDIRNFTSISEKLAPGQVVQFLNEYFTAMLDVLSQHGISVDKFIGDGILAYVEPHEARAGDPAIPDNQVAVQASLAMMDRLESLNEKFRELNLPAVKIGIGIYRGPLVIGLIGSEAKLQHTIIGDTVNRTARLEGLCKELGVSIVLSEAVWRDLPDRHKKLFRNFGQQAAKGLSTTMELYGGPIEAAS